MILQQPKRGVSAARNMGAEHAKADLVLCTDDDCRPDKDWIASFVETFDKIADASVVGGQVFPIWPDKRPRNLSPAMLELLSLLDWSIEARDLAENEYLVGANLAFRKEALLRAGGFDASLGRDGTDLMLLSGEETDLVNRIGGSGGRVYYQPKARVGHHIAPHRLSKVWFRRRAAWQAVSNYRMDPEKEVKKLGDYVSKRLQHGHMRRRPGLFSPVLDFFNRGGSRNSTSEIEAAYFEAYQLTMIALAGLELDAPDLDEILTGH